MAIITLNGEVRDRRGKGAARESRRQGKTPGVIYGKGEESLAISVGAKELLSVLHSHAGANVILDLKLAGQETVDRKALVRELQKDPLSGRITHIDLMHISMTQMITVDVPVHVSGLSIGVKDFGGILEFIMRTLEVECLPTDIPDEIVVDVAPLMIHDSIHVRDITVPNGRLINDPDQLVVTIVSPQVEKTATPGEEGVAAAEPEVIGKKKEDDAAKGEAEGKDKDKK
ncbi:MAG: 50S ribosomal protein L25 [Candidatus Eisenbacteria bacterium]|nr:50S ribosomal protein L25 [Candidatus Eisenbacteria bacterium]